MGGTLNKTNVTEAINSMLECLLAKADIDCRKCKYCEKVDACCFLMESVVVCQQIEKKGSNATE
jgi:hypothetical protein